MVETTETLSALTEALRALDAADEPKEWGVAASHLIGVARYVVYAATLRSTSRDSEVREAIEYAVIEIESFAEPNGTEDPLYLRGKQSGLRLAAAIVREALDRSPREATFTGDGWAHKVTNHLASLRDDVTHITVDVPRPAAVREVIEQIDAHIGAGYESVPIARVTEWRGWLTHPSEAAPTPNAQRDLANLIEGVLVAEGSYDAHQDEADDIADAILAAGYRRSEAAPTPGHVFLIDRAREAMRAVRVHGMSVALTAIEVPGSGISQRIADAFIEEYARLTQTRTLGEAEG